MKNFIILCSIIVLSSYQSYSQYSCSTAFEDFQNSTIAFPPVGTIAPTGPDYGSLDILGRPIWGFMMSCDSQYFSLNYAFSQSDPNSHLGMIVWGPFHSKTDACNNLSAANIYSISDSMLNIANIIYPPTVYGQSGQIFIFMLTTNDTTPNMEMTSWSFGGFWNLGGSTLPCYLCNDQVSQMTSRTMCLITFDSTSQNTKLIWEKIPDAGIAGYTIYRTGSMGGIMDSVGYVPESMPGEFVDYSSHALQYAEYYKFMPVDSCGNNYTFQEYSYNTAGFLQTYPSGNNTVNLNWNNFGVGQWVQQYEPVLYIHRGSSPQNMQIIDTIPWGVLNYTDISAPPGQQYYAVERRRLSPCDPLRFSSTSTAYTSSMTNPSVTTVTGLPVLDNDNIVSVNPVPASDFLTIKLANGMKGSKLTMVDLNGKVLNSGFVINTTEILDVSDLAAGSYWLCITGNSKVVKKIIIGK